MEELIRKLTEAISDFNRYIKNEYSAINKNYSGISNSLGDYSVYTLVQPKLDNYKINKTFPRANFIMVKINNTTDVVYLTTNTMTKEKLSFRDGSKYEGIFSDLYLSYDFTGRNPMPEVQIFIGYNSKYVPITTVKIADVDSSNPLPVNIVNVDSSLDYKLKTVARTINNTNEVFDFNTEVISSIMIANTSNSDTVYLFDENSTYNDGIPIYPLEKFSIDFNPISKSGFKMVLGTTGTVDVKILLKIKA